MPRSRRLSTVASLLCRVATLLAFAVSTVGVAIGQPSAGCCCGDDLRASGNCCCVKSVRKSCCGKTASQSCCGERKRRSNDDEERRPVIGQCSCGGSPSVLVNGDPRFVAGAPLLSGRPEVALLWPCPAPRAPAQSMAPETPPPKLPAV